MTNQEERFPEAKKTITNNYIDELIKKLVRDMTSVEFQNTWHTKSEIRSTLEKFINQVLQKQQDIIKECLPEEKGKTGFVSMIFGTNKGDREHRISVETNYDLGWNEGRQQLLDNLAAKGIHLVRSN